MFLRAERVADRTRARSGHPPTEERRFGKGGTCFGSVPDTARRTPSISLTDDALTRLLVAQGIGARGCWRVLANAHEKSELCPGLWAFVACATAG